MRYKQLVRPRSYDWEPVGSGVPQYDAATDRIDMNGGSPNDADNPDFNFTSPTGLRKLRRSYFEMKFNPLGGYVRNYDEIKTPAEMLKFLEERGRVGPDEALTEEQIRNRYEKYRHHVLAAMHADEGAVYG